MYYTTYSTSFLHRLPAVIRFEHSPTANIRRSRWNWSPSVSSRTNAPSTAGTLWRQSPKRTPSVVAFDRLLYVFRPRFHCVLSFRRFTCPAPGACVKPDIVNTLYERFPARRWIIFDRVSRNKRAHARSRCRVPESYSRERVYGCTRLIDGRSVKLLSINTGRAARRTIRYSRTTSTSDGI